MRDFDEIQNEDALDLLADILEPTVSICGDAEVKRLFGKKDKIELVKYIIKEHKSEILEILASIEGVKVEEFRCNVLTLPVMVLKLLNNKELLDFFSQYASAEEA